MATIIAVDVAKSVFEVAVSERAGRVREHHRLSRAQFSRFLSVQRPATILMEACGMAHFWGRQAQARGHRVMLLPPHAVRPYVPRNKTDRADAKGILEASRNQAIRSVPVKSITQQIIAALHRLRSTWLAARTARINTVRGLLREFGVVIPVGASHVVPRVRQLVAEPLSVLPEALRPALTQAADEIRELEGRIRSIEKQLDAQAVQISAATRLRTVPGIGLLTATALFAFVGDVERFPSGRHFSSYLGLTPRESSSGLRRRLGRISKHGDAYLRMLLIHGARAVLWHAKTTARRSRLQSWALKLEAQRGHNKAAVGLANKLARIAWAVWKFGADFTDQPLPRRH